MTDLRILIADDDALTRRSLVDILTAEPGLTVVGEARDGAEAVRFVAEHDVDLVLMDLRMPVMDGFAATRVIRDRTRDLPILVLTSYDTDQDILLALAAGASGHLLKTASPAQLSRAVHLAAAGLSVLSSEAAEVMRSFPSQRPEPAPAGAHGLSERDREVVSEVAAGASNREIARHLGLTEATVKTYVSRILTKMDCLSRAQLAVLARELRVDRLPQP